MRRNARRLKIIYRTLLDAKRFINELVCLLYHCEKTDIPGNVLCLSRQSTSTKEYGY